jgi:mannose-1-phosphate guanylyltransferase/mannose-6-phosphate isomerase
MEGGAREMHDRTFAVLMAGGSGTRFWPLSRHSRPKQVLPIADDRPIIRATVERLEGLVPYENVLIVTGGEQITALRAALPGLPAVNFLLEPVGRNTAPCIGLGALTALTRDPEAVLLCLPADHVIRPEEAFRESCRLALARADSARTLLTFGVRPDRPTTAYGYIREGEPTVPGVRRVERFTEKPDRATAESYLAEGGYRWNSGMFAWRADVFLEELGRHELELLKGLTRISEDPSSITEAFPALPSISVDYAVMERTDRAEVVAADFSWDDVGSLDSLARLIPDDGTGNHAGGELLAVDSRGLITVAPRGHLVAAMGVEDLIVIVTHDATLVCPRDRAEEVRALVQRLTPSGREDLT